MFEPWNGTLRAQREGWNGTAETWRAKYLRFVPWIFDLPADEKYSQLLNRLCAPLIREVCKQFRAQALKAPEAAEQLGISKRRFYQLYAEYLRAVSERKAHCWSPGRSGGDHRPDWPAPVSVLVQRLLKARCSYSMIASEVLRRFQYQVDRATVRRYALRHELAPSKPVVKRKPVRRWQTQQIGQLWQYDASPHYWFAGQKWQPTLLHIMDDHSRVITGARLYARETLLAHLDFLSQVFQACGLPLCLYVDYHSFFFTHTPEAHTQLAAALHFYDISLRYAPTPQAKGKIERGHQFWQNRLPQLFLAEKITELAPANELLETLRKHHNAMEKHREIGSTPQAAWEQASADRRSVLRPAPQCPWWPYVFSQRSKVLVGTDGKVAVAAQRLSVDAPPGLRLVHCLHPNGDITILKEGPTKERLPTVLLSTRLC